MPDPNSATTPEDLVRLLGELRTWAGSPSLREMRRLGGTVELADGSVVDALPTSTLSYTLRAQETGRLPRLRFVEAFVEACLLAEGGRPDRRPADLPWRWREAWRRVARAEGGTAIQAPSMSSWQTSPQLPHLAQLPPDINLFTGREPQLARLDRRLDEITDASGSRRAAPIAAITGEAGIGKTALALHWAHRVAHRFPDGQLFVELHGSSPALRLSSEAALDRLLRSLGVEVPPNMTGVDEKAALMRSAVAGRRLLILLDNAADIEQIQPLLPGSASCMTVVTSRDPLRRLLAFHDADQLPLAHLNAAEAGILLTGLLGFDRVRPEASSCAQLAELCGGRPMTLRCAAAALVMEPGRRIAEAVSDLLAARASAEL